MNTNCPKTNKPGRQVKTLTVESLTHEDLHEGLKNVRWFFCEDPQCDVIYFSDAGALLGRQDLRVRVGIKEKMAPHTICYCFGHTEESIIEEFETTNSSTVVDRITAEVRKGTCRCAEENPKGVCCLGDVRKVVRQITNAGGEEDPGHDCG